MKIFQSATLSADPIQNLDAVTKQYVDAALTTGVASGGLFFTDISPSATGIVGNKQFVPGTTPANRVIFEGIADTNNVRVTLFAEGPSSFYSPTIIVSTVPPQVGGAITATLVEDPSDKRAFTATVDLIGITADTVVTATSSTNATAVATIRRADAGPEIVSLTIGALPGGQTEAKQGDVVTVSGSAPNETVYAEIMSGLAANALSVLVVGAVDSAGAGFKTLTGTFTVSSASGLQAVQARARNTLGTFGSPFTSTNQITLSQIYPIIGARTVTYPASQSAVKNAESATVSATVTNFDTIAYTSSADLVVTAATTYSAAKTVTRASGTYVYGVNNYTITATRTANGAVTTASAAITISNAAPTAAITISGNPARLQSSAIGQNYTVTVTSNQRLNTAPVITPTSGTFVGSWAGGPTAWTRVLRITDADTKGGQTFTATLTNLANVGGSVITSGAAYIVGGFTTRTITFPAFARFAPIGTSVTDITRVSASYTGAAALTRYADTGDYFQGFTIVNSSGVYDPTGTHLYISDASYAGSNTTGTLQLDVVEAA